MTGTDSRLDGVRRPRRSDARVNRERILVAARAAFAERGIDVPLTAIARRAQVGPATLYRHFPTRGALVVEAFAEQFDACEAVLDEALADPDPWHGLCTVLTTVSQLQTADRGFTNAFLSRFADAVDYDRRLAGAERKLAGLVERAQRSGQLRADCAVSDLIVVLVANGGLVDTLGAEAPAAIRRLVGLLLRSFRADGAGSLPPPAAIGLEQVHQMAARG